MSIPTNLTKDIIDKVILDIDINDIPSERMSVSYFLEVFDKSLPPKYVIDKANKFVNKTDIKYNSIQSVKFLKELGYKIISKEQNFREITRKEFILRTLFKNGELNTDELTNAFYQSFPDKVDLKKVSYGDKFNEKQLHNQIRAELKAEINKHKELYNFIYGKWNKKYKYVHITLSDDGVKYYNDNFSK